MSELLRVSIRLPEREREPGIARLLELAAEGFEETLTGGEVELAVYTDRAGEERIRAVFAAVSSRVVPPGWEDAWRAFHTPVTVAGVWIGPPWERPPPGTPAVVVDPGRAFGTGAHPTTRLCVELLASLPRGSLLDVGCGSGVLSLAAARLGHGPITAVDVDPVAVETTRENAAVNGVVLEAFVLDALEAELPPVDAAVANILLAPVEAVLGRLGCAVAVTSGYLDGERPRAARWQHVERRELDGWAADAWSRRTSV